MTYQTVQALMFSAIILLLSSSAVLSGAQSPSVPAPPSPSQPDQPAAGCNKIVTELTPCIQYVTDKEDKPSQACCKGAKQLAKQIKTKQDVRTACECVKQLLLSLPDVDANRISQVPKACGIPFNLPPIDRNFDCSKISVMHAGLISTMS